MVLRFYQHRSADNATQYYSGSLSRGDYYTEEGRSVGTWHGLAAERLGLSGAVTEEAFAALAHNRDPVTGAGLTPRTRQDRTCCYDITIDAPKSVSLLWALTGDERIREAFAASVQETMLEMEQGMMTRVRKRGQESDRLTGNAVWATFIHDTSRPSAQDGLPDMNLHAHSVFFNLTYDPEEQRFKAGQFRELRRDAPYYQAAFEARLGDRLRQLGHLVERRGKSWEIAGIERGLIDKFSRRTTEIEAEAQRRGISDAKAKDQLGARTRRAKTQDLSDTALRRYWESRLTGEDQRALARVFDEAHTHKDTGRVPRVSAEQAMDFALRHLFGPDGRESVVGEKKLLAEALRYGVGSVTVEGVQQALQETKVLTGEREGRRLVTTPEILAIERRMIAFARDGRGVCKRLGLGKQPFTSSLLNADQQAAIRQALASHDRVILIEGDAGTGKTEMDKELVQYLGRPVALLAPSAGASRGELRERGFRDANTLKAFLDDAEWQAKVRGGVLLLDEASLASTRQVAELFDTAVRLDARVILQGDAKQHKSVEAGDVLRVLKAHGGLEPIRLREIVRQQHDAYKAAVADLAAGRLQAGFQKLDTLGWIKEVPESERYGLLARDYVDVVRSGRSCLVVSPTHAEGARVTASIRAELKRAGRLGPEEHTLLRLEKVDLSAAERGEAHSYEPGMVLQYHQRTPGGIKAGTRVTVEDPQAVPLAQAERFQVYRPGSLTLAAGETVRFTQNGHTLDGKHRLNNGDLRVVKGFTRQGNLLLDNGWVVGKSYGHLTPGYVVTSHASQGKSVQVALVAQSALSAPAASLRQFYVSGSRGKQRLAIYTDSKQDLLDSIRHDDVRLSATELVGAKTALRERLLKHVAHLQRWANLAQGAAERAWAVVRPREIERGLEYGR